MGAGWSLSTTPPNLLGEVPFPQWIRGGYSGFDFLLAREGLSPSRVRRRSIRKAHLTDLKLAEPRSTPRPKVELREHLDHKRQERAVKIRGKGSKEREYTLSSVRDPGQESTK